MSSLHVTGMSRTQSAAFLSQADPFSHGYPHQAAEMPFIVSTGMDKRDADMRKFIRSQVMLGKNRGKTYPKRKAPRRPRRDVSEPKKSEHRFPTTDASVVPLHSAIPSGVGTVFSFTRFADEVEPSTIALVIQFSSIAKKAMFPLEPCIHFDKKDAEWMAPLTFDAAYLHTMVFSTQAYFGLISSRETQFTGPSASPHYSKAVRILRERLTAGDEQAKISNTTTSVVLSMAGHAYLTGQYEAAKHHMEGLQRIVELRGGVGSFMDNPKFLIKLLGSDIIMSLHSGSGPLFFRDPFLEPFLPYPNLVSSSEPENDAATNSQRSLESLHKGIDGGLAEICGVMQRFSTLVNLAAQTNRKLPKETYLYTMASVMYRLLHLSFEIGSLNEAIRLGSLAFSFSIFLQWQGIRLRCGHFPNIYRECLAQLRFLDVSPQLLLWLLMVGAVSVLSEEDDTWLRSWLRAHIELYGVESWEELRALLKPLMWIDLVHDKPGKDVYDSIFCQPGLSG